VSGIVRLARCPYCKGTTFETRTCLMIATVFDEVGSVAVLQVDKLSDPGVGVAFGEKLLARRPLQAGSARRSRARIQTARSGSGRSRSRRSGPKAKP